MFLRFDADTGNFDFYKYSGTSSFGASDVRSFTHATGDTGPNDILHSWPGTDSSMRRHSSLCFNIYQGLVVAICECFDKIDGVWTSNGTSLCWFDESEWTPGDPPPWGAPFVSQDVYGDVQSKSPRNSTFNCQCIRTFDEYSGEVIDAWIAFSDYINNGLPSGNSYNANFFLSHFTRSDTSPYWRFAGYTDSSSIPPVQRVLSLSFPSMHPLEGMHAHPPYVDRYGDEGLCVVCPVGDSRPNNLVVALYRSDETFTAGEADPGDAGVANGWTTRFVHGTQGRTGTPPDFDATKGDEGNQFVGSAPAPVDDEGNRYNFIGADEQFTPITKVVAPPDQIDPTGSPPPPPATPAKFNFEKVWGQPAGGILRGDFGNVARGWNVFRLARYGIRSGPYAAVVVPDSNWSAAQPGARFIYSQDGTYWSHLYAHHDADATRPLAIAGGDLYCSFLNISKSVDASPAGTPTRIVRMPLPLVFLAHPLALGGPGNAAGRNRMLATPTAPTSTLAPGGTNTLGAPISWPTGIPQPPTLGTVWQGILSDTSNQDLGTFAVTDGNTPPGRLKLRMFLLTMPWDAMTNPYANSLSLEMSVGIFVSATGVSTSRELINLGTMPMSGSWTPITMDLDTSSWVSDSNAAASPSSVFTLGVRLRSGYSSQFVGPNHCDFLLAFDSVVAEGPAAIDHPGLPLPQETAGLAPEQVSLGGFTCGTSWTIMMLFEVPDDNWDQTVPDRPRDNAICTFVESSTKWIKLSAVPDSLLGPGYGAIRATVKYSSTADPIEILVTPSRHIPVWDTRDEFGIEQFCFHRGTPISIAATLDGSTNTLTIYASVGTQLWSGSAVISGAPKPTAIKSGDENNLHPEAMNWWGGKVNTAVVLDAATVVQQLKTLLPLHPPHTFGGITTYPADPPPSPPGS